MLARILKKVWRSQMSNYFEKPDLQSDSPRKSEEALRNKAAQIEKNNMEEEEEENQLKENAIDFLNLVFGKSRDTDKFWSEILVPLVYSTYQYQIKKSEIPLGGLLMAFCFQAKIRLNLPRVPPLGEIENPLEGSYFTGFVVESKTFAMTETMIQKYIVEKNESNDAEERELNIRKLRVKLKIMQVEFFFDFRGKLKF